MRRRFSSALLRLPDESAEDISFITSPVVDTLAWLAAKVAAVRIVAQHAQVDVPDSSWQQRDYPLREVFNGLRWMARGDSSWRMMPHDLSPYYVVYQQMRRWLKAGVFEAITHDLRAVLRIAEGRQEMPTASIFDGRTLQSTVESGARAGYDGAKRRKSNKVHF